MTVRAEVLLDVIEGEPRLWPDAAGLKAVGDQREGMVNRQPEPLFLTFGVDKISGA